MSIPEQNKQHVCVCRILHIQAASQGMSLLLETLRSSWWTAQCCMTCGMITRRLQQTAKPHAQAHQVHICLNTACYKHSSIFTGCNVLLLSLQTWHCFCLYKRLKRIDCSMFCCCHYRPCTCLQAHCKQTDWIIFRSSGYRHCIWLQRGNQWAHWGWGT